MAGHLPAAIHVVVIDRVAEVLGSLVVDNDHRHAVLQELRAVAPAERCGAQDDSISAVLNHRPGDLALALGGPVSRADEQTVPAALAPVVDALQDLAEKWVVDAAEDDPQHL